MSVVLATPDCTPKCRSVRHADEVVAALTRGSEGCLRAFLTAHCHNAAKLRDAFGRTALHLAASLGKKALLDWLLESKSADLMVKDKESGWTALHRSVFYGHIHCLMSLVKHGGNLFTQDKEGLSVLDLTMKDRPAHVVFTKTDPTEVYTWGNNANFSLGHGNQESRHHPEIVDVFARTGVYIKQVVLCKFHSVFLSQKGQVYTCGHGQGGRLGHGDEQTYLVPRMVEGLMSHHCSQVSAAKDHTVVLTEEGYVYTFGLNTYHQLGLAPPPASSHLPKQVFSKTLKGRTVIGVAAGRFHTVLWTREAVYSMGLNGGQLGYLLDPNGEKCVTTPRQVSALHHKDISIAMVAASNGATVVVTEKGDVYLLADYQCKKLVSRQLNIRKVLVSGGSLDHRVDPQVLNEGGGEKVAILALDEAGRVFCWRSVGGSVRQCRWAYGRQVFMSDIALSRNTMMFVTQEGEGFSGQWHGEYRRSMDKKDGSAEVCGHPEAGTVYERIRLEKLPYVHRAVSITMDSKGRNFGVLQSDPKTGLYEIPIVSSSSFSQHFRSLLEEADETDGIHDVTLQAGHCTFPAHKYLLSMRSEFFRKQLAVGGAEQGVRDGEVTRSEDASGCDLLVLEKVSYEMLEHVLKFIYTDTCELLIQGHRPRVSGQKENQQDPEQLISNLQDLGLEGGLRGHSALEVYRSLPTSALRDGKKPKNKGAKSGKKAKVGKAGPREGGGGVDPVKALQGVAKKLGISSLSARLDGVKYENGKINVVHKKTGNKLRFNQNKCSYLCDVTLRSDDGKEFPCHKCVLCARLEYFHSMLGNPWFEATSCSALEMPTSSEILQVILEYVYTDESPTVKECVNVEFVCNVLVVADQLLITRLKEMCEVALTENLTLKNAAELLEFAAMYNAEQLKVSCLQFIVLNMAALLESKALEILRDDVLMELSTAYRRMVPAMQRRLITPYPDAPDLSGYEDEDWDLSISSKVDTELEPSCRETLLKKAKLKAKKKPRRRSDSSGGYTLSDIIQSPPASALVLCTGLEKWGKSTSMESLQELLTSDSEGSYMGAGSPRDLPSPIFPDRPEDERAGGGAKTKTPPGTPTTARNGLCAVSLKGSAPEPTPTTSPARPLPVMDLRAIMDMEASSKTQSLGATPKSPGVAVGGSGGKQSPLPAKLSQKQRKMIAMASKEGSGEGACLKSHPSITPSKSAKAWATPVQTPLSFRSFRDLLVEEETRVRSGGPGSSGGQGTLVPNVSAARRVTFKSPAEPPSEPERSAGPWVLGAVGSPPMASMVTFASIVEEAKQQEAALIRSREKPLALIQIEEAAIQELLLHYGARSNPDELIVVERSALGPIATPFWNKH
ncbi:inhibitor of Bruton tyrosine kinase isoform X2 [Esox lucius]|uniref:inhibitor of Bruton tyrosine kinase isoform X2 n=1 Tax=Esox lucius TaxID=8010 RepID=UPI001476C91E|nr:inhibitor of Bruton tyrosine kinase isoform X2 [Esox lucius]